MGRLSLNGVKILTLLLKPDHQLVRREGYKFAIIEGGFVIRQALSQTIKSLVDRGFIEGIKKDDRGFPMEYILTEDGKSFAEFVREGENETQG